jgi:GrpB-like predicted nucleotidyltransferase (UPF0157 family)
VSASLGLRPHEVVLSKPDADWATAFETEKETLAEALGRLVLDIQHVGSTAVPDLSAKPIIDIAIAVPADADIDTIGARLRAAGYEFGVNAGSDGGYIYFREVADGLRTHHVHLIEATDPQWTNYLRFRECLRRDARLRRAYERLKSTLASRFPRDRDAYTSAKAEFIVETIESARRAQ